METGALNAHYDFIVVGSGSAGGTVASRLSDDPSKTILLLEAGELYTSPEEIPERYLDPRQSAVMPGQPGVWRRVATLKPGTTVPNGSGKVIGGSSSVNGTYFIRGRRADFDAWAAAGNTEWAYDNVLPFFKRTESDQDFANDLHGSDGPIPVRRESRDRAPEFINSFTEASLASGFTEEKDKNGDQPSGVGAVPLNISDGKRFGTALGYILPCLNRPNFHVRGDAHVLEVLTARGRVTGVRVNYRNEVRTVNADQVILSAGGIKTPQLLMLSGIGPEKALAAHDIKVRMDAPGVGQGLHAHPGAVSHYSLKNPIENLPGRGAMTSALHWTADGATTPDELEILPFMRTTIEMVNARANALRHPIKTIKGIKGVSWRTLVAQAEGARAQSSAVLGVMNNTSRGTVTLTSADPMTEPAVNFNFLNTDHDIKRFREVVRTYYEILDSAPMRRIGAKAIGISRRDLQSTDKLDEWVRSHLLHGAHDAATCHMGPDSDPTAVVDQFGRVKGIEGLRICDTSIWPAVTSRGPNATAIMTGELVTDFIARGH